MPWSMSSSGLSSEWVVLAGWMTRDLTSATFARRLKSCSLSMKSWASLAPPLMRNVKIEPAPFGKYSLYSRFCSGSSDSDGWLMLSTSGTVLRYSMTFRVFSTWRSTRSERVSRPWRKMKLWNGESVEPVSRRRIARILVMKAAGPAA